MKVKIKIIGDDGPNKIVEIVNYEGKTDQYSFSPCKIEGEYVEVTSFTYFLPRIMVYFGQESLSGKQRIFINKDQAW